MKMTAEIVIMNREAIALAADSAVSLMGGQVERPQKIFTSADKIFELSPDHFVCFMIFNYASFMGIPWEIIFAHYRRKIRSLAFSSTEECAKDFISFLANDEDLVPPDGEENYFITNAYRYFLFIKDLISQSLNELATSSGAFSEEEVLKIPASTVQGIYENLVSAPFAASMTQDDIEALRNRYDDLMSQAISDVFASLPLPEDTITHLKTIPPLFFAKESGPSDPLSPDYSGVVVAGFGSKDNFPSLIEYRIEGRLNRKLKYTEQQTVRITFKNGAEIVPFGQHEMVDIFLSGMDPVVEEGLIQHISATMHQYPDAMIDSIEELSDEKKSNYRIAFHANTDEIVKNLTEELNKYRMSNLAPVINVVVALPKSELAALAESLVNITSLRKRVSIGAETVGGPVDVAVISKNDGFVWIKKKQYYPAAINPFYRGPPGNETRGNST